MDVIEYPVKAKFELWVEDKAAPEAFAIYVDGGPPHEVDLPGTNKFPIVAPDVAATTSIVVQFGGIDGGISAIVDVTDGTKKTLAKQSGTRHEYQLKAK